MLRPHEPPPFEIVRPNAPSRIVICCDHASHRVPEALGSLGVSQADLETHIGWDIGAAAVARHLSVLLDAALLLSTYSRLVIDCNRPPHVATSIPTVSGGVQIPGNENLDDAAREARRLTFFAPYHQTLAALLDTRFHPVREGDTGRQNRPVLLSIHSFTPELHGQKRPWPISLLYGRDTRLAHLFRDRLRQDPALLVGDNEPYRVTVETDYTLPTHGIDRGILHTAFEIRQNGVDTEEGARAWAERIAAVAREIV